MNYRVIGLSLVLIPFVFFSITEAKENTSDATNIKSVTIGKQVWMVENLYVTTYQDGTPIPQVQDPLEWNKVEYGAWCYYDNDTNNGKIYGKLYNWYAVNNPHGLAPSGWHIPKDSEWKTLTKFLGGKRVAGGKLKAKGTREKGNGLWYSPNQNVTNSSGFSGLPGGYRYLKGTYMSLGSNGYWWSSSSGLFSAKYFNMYYDNTIVNRYSINKKYGYSVRCIKD